VGRSRDLERRGRERSIPITEWEGKVLASKIVDLPVPQPESRIMGRGFPLEALLLLINSRAADTASMLCGEGRKRDL